MDISVIIPVYNVEEYVEECLRSVMAQDASCTIECLVIDDRGADNSMEVVKRVLTEYTGPISFHIITHEKNGGLSAARNTGIKSAKGTYLYFLDSDDTITSYCLSSLWRHVQLHPTVNIVYGKTESRPDSERKRVYFNLKDKGAIEFQSSQALIRAQYIDFPVIACNKLINTEWLKSNGLYFKEQILHEDLHWHLMSYEKINSYACELNVGSTYIYRVREGSIMNRTDDRLTISNLIDIYTDLAARITVWDAHIMKVFCNTFVHIKRQSRILTDKNNIRARLRRLFATITDNTSIGLAQKLIFMYLALPAPIANAKVSDLIIKILVK